MKPDPDSRPVPARPEHPRTACLRARPTAVSTRPRPDTKPAARDKWTIGPRGLWLRRLAWSRLRARTFCHLTGSFDGTDLP